ncbi:hypothetical protein [Thermoactinomyces daqus]|nr:hypothetical protein [Thermoactinomyces daqus]
MTDDEIEMLLSTLPIHFHSVTEEENKRIDPDDYIETHIIVW